MDTYPTEPEEPRAPFRWTRVGASAMKAFVASLVGVLVFVFIGMRAVNPELVPWGPDVDQQMVAQFGEHLNSIADTLEKFLALIPVLAAGFGGLWNAWKNWDRPSA